MQNHNLQLLIKHIEDTFDINPATNLLILYEGCWSKVLQHPIPGLHLPDKHYKCPDCGLWHSNYQNHVKLELGCKQSNMVSKQFSVPSILHQLGLQNNSLAPTINRSSQFQITKNLPLLWLPSMDVPLLTTSHTKFSCKIVPNHYR